MERTSREETPEGDGSIAALDELELEVEAVVGSCRVSLDELRRLGPGQALSLQRPADGTVEIRVQRRKVGEGELIDVDGVLAVRLTRWEGERS